MARPSVTASCGVLLVVVLGDRAHPGGRRAGDSGERRRGYAFAQVLEVKVGRKPQGQL
jgi:hypothetical protein